MATCCSKTPTAFGQASCPGLKDGDLYRFYVAGTGSEGFTRDPCARELEFNGYPDSNCIVRARRGKPSLASTVLRTVLLPVSAASA
jgi:hypothetical protein